MKKSPAVTNEMGQRRGKLKSRDRNENKKKKFKRNMRQSFHRDIPSSIIDRWSQSDPITLSTAKTRQKMMWNSTF